jgi:hypothetical protein
MFCCWGPGASSVALLWTLRLASNYIRDLKNQKQHTTKHETYRLFELRAQLSKGFLRSGDNLRKIGGVILNADQEVEAMFLEDILCLCEEKIEKTDDTRTSRVLVGMEPLYALILLERRMTVA